MASITLHKPVKAKPAENVPQIMKQGRITPWLYLAPAIVLMTIYIVVPMFNTTYLSFLNRDSSAPASATCMEGRSCWGIFENYHYALTSELNLNSVATAWNSFWLSSFGNNIKWIVVMVSGTVGIGLVFAVLTSRVRYESQAKSAIFLPMAISFVGAGVIWGLMYAFRPAGQAQIGFLNGLITSLGGDPVAFLITAPRNTYMLIIVGIWIWTGFSMTILSAALKSVPQEVLEAARIDGANESQVFFKIMVPIIAPTITVVVTTMVVNVLKLFDIVYVMTGGNYKTDVIAVRMYTEMYINYHTGRGAAIAVILILLIIPFMYINIQRFLEEEANR